jgi:hypothetical protein
LPALIRRVLPASALSVPLPNPVIGADTDGVSACPGHAMLLTPRCRRSGPRNLDVLLIAALSCGDDARPAIQPITEGH